MTEKPISEELAAALRGEVTEEEKRRYIPKRRNPMKHLTPKKKKRK